MCGIFGIVEQGKRNVDPKLSSMSAAMFHRGPDDQNWETDFLTGHSIGYGINRLAIIDVAGGRQPISNEDDSIRIVYNGEVYNYKDLRRELQGKGHMFKTDSDTECILHLYEEYGADCVHHLRGMFAFCIYDRGRQKLFLARDHVGIKPMYYHHNKGMFAFASEIKGLLTFNLIPGLDFNAVLSYFTFRYVPGPNTIYKGITSLAAGHHLTYDLRTDKVTTKRWWIFDHSTVRDSYDDAKAKIRHFLTESVRLRLQSEVPLGAYLSGGVDSSIISAIVAKELNHEINVYNIGYEGTNEYAEHVSRELGFNYFQCPMDFEDVVGVLDDALYHMDQPLSDAACLPTLYLSRIVKHGVTVMLSGEGADELFAGYWQYEGLMKARPQTDLSVAAMRDYLQRSSYFLGANRIFTPGSGRRFTNPLKWAMEAYNSGNASTLLSRVINVDLNTWLLDDLLMKVDKMSMAASVEARVPFLDPRLIEYVNHMPDHYKYHQGTTKRILKDVAEDLGLPQMVTRRPKMGFTVPIHDLLRGPFKTRLREGIRSQQFRGIPYVNHKRVNQIVREFYKGNDEWGLFCWTLFIFTAWLGTDRRS